MNHFVFEEILKLYYQFVCSFLVIINNSTVLCCPLNPNNTEPGTWSSVCYQLIKSVSVTNLHQMICSNTHSSCSLSIPPSTHPRLPPPALHVIRYLTRTLSPPLSHSEPPPPPSYLSLRPPNLFLFYVTPVFAYFLLNPPGGRFFQF